MSLAVSGPPLPPPPSLEPAARPKDMVAVYVLLALVLVGMVAAARAFLVM